MWERMIGTFLPWSFSDSSLSLSLNLKKFSLPLHFPADTVLTTDWLQGSMYLNYLHINSVVMATLSLCSNDQIACRETEVLNDVNKENFAKRKISPKPFN